MLVGYQQEGVLGLRNALGAVKGVDEVLLSTGTGERTQSVLTELVTGQV